MTCGLLAAHGVFFGACKPADAENDRGFFEHLRLKRERPPPEGFAGWWREAMERDGWREGTIWGVKANPAQWRSHWAQVPGVACAIHCVRPVASAVMSMAMLRGRDPAKVRGTVEARYRAMEQMRRDGRVPCVIADTPAIARHDFATILPAFAALGIAFDEARAAEWVSPGMWRH